MSMDMNFCFFCDELLNGKCRGVGTRGALCAGEKDMLCKSWDKTCEPFRKLKESLDGRERHESHAVTL